MEKLYNKEVFWKKNFNSEAFKLCSRANRLSFHLQEHIENPDNKHNYTENDIYNCLDKIKSRNAYLFEVAEENNKVTKAVYRVKMNDNYNMCIVIRANLIVTAWLNRINDTHATLDKSKYARG